MADMEVDQGGSSSRRSSEKAKLKVLIKKYFNQLTMGCGNFSCRNFHCASTSGLDGLV